MIDKIIAYENGELSEEEILELFQELVNTGTAWTLQGSYGRTATAFIEQGLITKRVTLNGYDPNDGLCNICRDPDYVAGSHPLFDIYEYEGGAYR